MTEMKGSILGTVLHLHAISTRLDRISDQVLKDACNISFHQFLILSGIATHDDLPQRTVAAYLGLTEAAVSKQVEVLKQQEFIERTTNPENRREVRLSLTKSGRAVLAVAEKSLRQPCATLLSTITNQERTVLTHAATMEPGAFMLLNA